MSQEKEEITLDMVFSKHLGDVKFDKNLIKRIYTFHVWYLNKNQQHLAFFGSNLLGVHIVRFTDSDIIKFHREVLGIDFDALERDIRKVTTIIHEFKISGDVFNLTLMYMIHRCLTSTYLNEGQRQRGAYDTALVFFYRCIAAIQSDYFHFPADPKIAQAAYAELDLKFLIKKLGSWYKVMDYRAKALTDKDTKWYQDFIIYNDDQRTVEIINDAQGSIRSMYKYYYRVFDTVHKSGLSIKTTASTMMDVEGVEKVREKVLSVERYITFIRNIIIDPQTFVRSDVVDVILSINTNTSVRTLTNVLNWMSENYSDVKWHAMIDDYITQIITYSFHLLQDTGGSDKVRDYPTLLINLKNLYLSTRSTDPELIKIRNLGEKLIKASMKGSFVNRSLMTSTRTSTILYITFRALITTKI